MMIIETLLSIDNNLNKIDYRRKEIKRVLKEFNLKTQDVKKMIHIYKHRTPKLDDINDIILKSLDYNQLVSFIQINQLDFIKKNKKKILLQNILNYYSFYVSCVHSIHHIITIQSLVRKYMVLNKYKYQGECLFNRKLSLNEEDFYTCDNINHIPLDYFFSYKDKDGFHYSYDIRSFQKLMNYDVKNPYNRFDITDDVIEQYHNRLSYLKKKNIHILEENQYHEMNPKQIFRDKVLSTFQTLNELGHYCNMDWFFHLTNRQLKQWIILN